MSSRKPIDHNAHSSIEADTGLPPGRDLALGHARGQADDPIANLLREWRDDARIRANAQQLAAAEDARNNAILGSFVIALAAVGGSATLAGSGDTRIVAIAGTLTLVAAVLAGVQTVLKFGERSGDHRGAAASFNRVKTRLDLVLARMTRGREPTDDEIDDHLIVMERLDTETPVVANRLWTKAVERIKSGVVA
jgi:hypothetical protein